MKQIIVHGVEGNEKMFDTLGVRLWGGHLKVSDGYHTIDELYEHRIELFIAVCRLAADIRKMADDSRTIVGETQVGPLVWRSHLHSDGTRMAGWFVLGIYKEKGKQITYHLPIARWDDCGFAEELERGPDWDGHTSEDVIERLKSL